QTRLVALLVEPSLSFSTGRRSAYDDLLGTNAQRARKNCAHCEDTAVKFVLRFLRVAPQEGRNVQVVRGHFAGYFADIFLHLVDDVGLLLRLLLWRLGNFAAGLPGLGQERRPLLRLLLVGVLET